MTHFATADDDPAFADEQLARFLPWAADVRARAPDVVVPRRELAPRRSAIPDARLRPGPLRDRRLRHGPVPARPGRPRPRAGARAALATSPRSSASRRARARGTGGGSSPTRPWLARDAPDRLRRRRAARADQQRRGAGRRPARAARRHRARWTTSPSTSPDAPVGPRRAEAVLIGRARRASGSSPRRSRARIGTINYEITCGISARVPRVHGGMTRAAGRSSRPSRAGRASARGSSAARCATGCSAGRRDDLDVAVDGDVRAAPRGRSRRATGGDRVPAVARRSARWRVVGAGPRLAGRPRRRCAGGDIEPTTSRARDFTINAMAEPLAGGELLDPHGGVPTSQARRLRMVGPAALDDDPLRTLRAVAPRVRAGARDRARTAARGERPRAAARPRSRPSACSPSSSGSSDRTGRARRGSR